MKIKRTGSSVACFLALAMLFTACSPTSTPPSATTASHTDTTASVTVATQFSATDWPTESTASATVSDRTTQPVATTDASTSAPATGTAATPSVKPSPAITTTTGVPVATTVTKTTTTTRQQTSAATTAKQEVSVTVQTTTTTTTKTTAAKTEPAWKAHPEQYKLIALTFDDAPGDATTSLVDTVARYEGAGTLFIQGNMLNDASDYAAVQHALDNGFELGNHTYSHPYLTKIGLNEILSEIRRTQELVEDGFGITMKYLRPGYLATDNVVLGCAKMCHMSVIHGHWNSIEKRYRSLEKETVDSTVRTCLSEAYDGAIFLMHSTNWTTANALDTVCSELYNQGYRFVTLSELFAMKGITDIPNEPIEDVNQLLD